MLVLCPNHHKMFDLLIPEFLSGDRISIGGELFTLGLKHKLSPDVTAYHNKLRHEQNKQQAD